MKRTRAIDAALDGYAAARREAVAAVDKQARLVAELIPPDRHLLDTEIDTVVDIAVGDFKDRASPVVLAFPGYVQLYCETFRGAFLRHRMALEAR